MENSSFEKPPIEIERATLVDLESYKKIRLEALEKDPQAFGEKLEDALKKTEKDWKKYLIDKNRVVFLAKDGSEAIGLARMEIRDKEIGFISSVYVRNEFRHKGIAKKILKDLEDEIKNRGRKKAVLYVSKNSNDVKEFYRKIGYSLGDNLKKYDKYEGMEKYLK